jgi:FKBP-type peptidyl-prolyl cis-trans isomerase
MKRLLLGTVALALTAAANAQEPPKLETVTEQFSFAMGYRMTRETMSKGFTQLDAEALAAGARAAAKGQPFPYSREKLQEIMTGYRTLLESAQAEQANNNAEEGRAFLAGNENAEGVKVLDGGVQYKVITEGSGALPAANSTVKVHYSGKLLNGTEFDSSYKRGAPTELSLQGVIPGWRTALASMPTGSKWLVWIPSDQAYGANGAGGLIGPNSTLQFEIELLEVVKE